MAEPQIGAGRDDTRTMIGIQQCLEAFASAISALTEIPMNALEDVIHDADIVQVEARRKLA